MKPQGVTKSVHVTAMWGPGKALEETRWLQSVADKHGFPHGIVSNVDLADPGVEAALKAQKQFPNLRGVRADVYWDAIRFGSASAGRFLQSAGLPPRLRAAGEARPAVSNCKFSRRRRQYAVDLIKAFPTCG